MRMSHQQVALIVLLLLTVQAYAFTWQDLWATKDQQGRTLMDKKQFKQANETFLRPDWQATAAYRAGDYEQAAKLFSSAQSEDAYYNQGNALAYLGKYQEAINAYSEALKLVKDYPDAQHNIDVLKKLLQQQSQQNQSKNQPDKNNQEQNKNSPANKQQDQSQNGQQNKSANKQSKPSQSNQQQNGDNKNDSGKQNSQNSTNATKENDSNSQQQQTQQQNDTNSHAQNSQANPTQQPTKQQNDTSGKEPGNKEGMASPQQQSTAQDKQATQLTTPSAKLSKEQKEDQQVKSMLLQVPDDPGGLLRNKFLRDYQNQKEANNND